jgi:prepilin-type N-terminal cleavage/methylation domain-containing protein
MSNNPAQNNKQTNRGFTLLETMVAIFILVLSITGPMVFAQSGLRAAFLARDQVTAFFLAQDAIETIKNIRDENGLQGDPWLSGICEDSSTGPCVIKIDTTDEDPVAEPCLGGTCPLLYLDPDARYVHDSGSPNIPSRFTRTIYVQELGAGGREAQLVVEVEWDSNVRVGNSRVIVQENIYNWIPVLN